MLGATRGGSWGYAPGLVASLRRDKLFDDLAVTNRQLLRDHPAHSNAQHRGSIDAARL